MYDKPKWCDDMYLSDRQQQQRALGGDVTIGFTSDLTAKAAAKVFSELWKSVFAFERQHSRFIPDSELSQFNRAAGQAVPISVPFREILLAARHWANQTNGLYNPFILPALHRAGYRQSAVPGYEADVQEDHRHKAVVSIDKLQIGDNWATIPYNTAIDLGGIGKGYLADQLGAYLQQLGVAGYWLSLSGDVAAWGHDAAGEPLRVAIQDANQHHGHLPYQIRCHTAAAGVATSGTFHRSNQPHQIGHHLIDPRTGRPATTDLALATVVAKSATAADILASCAVILGSDQAPDFLHNQSVKAYVLQSRGHNPQRFGDHYFETAAELVNAS
jgi:thiamine biosynthesis lipoprotein